jgi:hypothetical protein
MCKEQEMPFDRRLLSVKKNLKVDPFEPVRTKTCFDFNILFMILQI